MKKASSTRMRREYRRSDFPDGFVRGKYAARMVSGGSMVFLDPENAAAFPTSEAVNEALAGLIRVAKAVRLTRRSNAKRPRA
jgi:hypothetical protein